MEGLCYESSNSFNVSNSSNVIITFPEAAKTSLTGEFNIGISRH